MLTVINLPTGEAVSGLSAHDAIKHIYQDDGGDYRLEPKMVTNCDDEGNDLLDSQEIGSDGKLVFEIWFKQNINRKFLKSQLTTEGFDESDAENNFLDDALKFNRFDSAKWSITSDEDYAAQLKQAIEDDQS